MPDWFSIYLIPPVLTLVVGLALAVMVVARGRFKGENVLLSLICIWWSMLAPAFISHHLFDDPALLLRIERSIHFFYVFIPAINILFFQSMIRQRRPGLVIGAFVLSTIFSLLTQTEYYFTGMIQYRWGYIARGGIAFQLFSLYGTAVVLYLIGLFAWKLRTERNPVMRLKIKYLFISFITTGILTATNVPAMNGIDFYPLGNFLFIPLLVLTYGILRYRLMEIQSVIHHTAFWFILSSFIAIPNIVLFLFMSEFFLSIGKAYLFAIFILWFFLNYIYFNRIQPLIDQLFNRRNYNLARIEAEFIEDISLLKNLDELVGEFITILKKTLPVRYAHLFVRNEHSRSFVDMNSREIRLPNDMERFLYGNGGYLEKGVVESDIEFPADRESALRLFDETGSLYLFPLIHKNDLMAVLFLPEKANLLSLSDREARFINNICAYASIALSNSIMYQNLSRLKDNLERMVDERTSIIEKQKALLEKEISLAKEIQMALLPNSIPKIDEVAIAFKYVPIMGVGGDFIDIHYRKGMNELGLFVSDVSGHGVPAALVASMVKMSLNSWGKFIQWPASALGEMKNMLSGKMGGNFISACICCLDLSSGVLISANAGHPPLIIARADGRVEPVRSRGRVFLDFTEPDYEEVRSVLGKGDKVVLYTDGITEARNRDGQMMGDDTFVGLIAKYASLSASDLCEMIFSEIVNYTGSQQLDDDFALLVAEYRG